MRRSGSTSFGHVRRALSSEKLWNTAAGASGLGAFALQATSSDRTYAQQQGLLNNFTPTQKIEQWVNWLTSRLTFGMINQPFTQVYAGNVPTFQIGNTLNKFTGAGIVTGLYGAFAKGFPLRSKVKKFSIPLLLGGIIGGLFDDPVAAGLNRGTSLASPRAPTSQGLAGVRRAGGVNSR